MRRSVPPEFNRVALWFRLCRVPIGSPIMSPVRFSTRCARFVAVPRSGGSRAVDVKKRGTRPRHCPREAFRVVRGFQIVNSFDIPEPRAVRRLRPEGTRPRLTFTTTERRGVLEYKTNAEREPRYCFQAIATKNAGTRSGGSAGDAFPRCSRVSDCLSIVRLNLRHGTGSKKNNAKPPALLQADSALCAGFKLFGLDSIRRFRNERNRERG